jgi:hypothetical protein
LPQSRGGSGWRLTQQRMTKMIDRGIVKRMSGRLSMGLAVAACGVASAVAVPATAASASVPHSTSCAKWGIAGTWAVIQSNEKVISTFVFAEKGKVLTGTATYGTTRGIINGALNPDSAKFTIKWPSGGVGHYFGEISTRSINGNTYEKKGKAKWSGTGPTSCRA